MKRGLTRFAARRVPPLARILDDRARWRARAADAGQRLARERRRTRALRKEVERLSALNTRLQAPRVEVEPDAEVIQLFPAGHFYSPIADLSEVRAREDQIFDRSRPTLPGIDLRPDAQLALLPAFAALQPDMPFDEAPRDGLRYGFVNEFFSFGDGQALYSVLRHFRPQRLIEIGSGWSSALTLDVNDRFFDGAMKCTFVEPFPDRLHSLLRPADHQRVELIEEPLHHVDEGIFGTLTAGDLLFIDSTHVSRVGSDVNRLFLDVIPGLPPGVLIHVHDVFWPFEYPAGWVYQGRSWNENYLLRALMISNSRLEIVWFNDYLAAFHADDVEQALPGWRRNPGGSIYLRTL